MKNRQFETMDEVEAYRKQAKKEKKKNSMSQEEYDVLRTHLDELHRKAMEGDAKAVSGMYLWLSGLLAEKRKATVESEKHGKKAGRKTVAVIVPLAVGLRRELVGEIGQVEWSLLVDEVLHKAQARGIKDKRTVKKVLEEYRSLIEEQAPDDSDLFDT